jgi:acetylornithine deacetylase
MTKTEKLLRDLIALPSVNPAFLPDGHPRAGEQRVAEFLAATVAQAGLEVEFQKVFAGRSNLIARLSPRGKVTRRVVLAPHLDTVNADESQFVPRTRNGRMFGRGACDTKGSVAAMVGALCELARGGGRSGGTEIVFAGLVDEENGQGGSRALASSGLQADLGIIGEPTRLQVVTAHKGSLWLRLETRGKAAHGAEPERGVNAVAEMAQVVVALEGAYATELRRRARHPLLGCGSVNVGTISGGTQANIVPDECTIMVDRRTLPGETESSVWHEIRKLLLRRGLHANFVDGRLGPCLPMETDAKVPLVVAFLRSAGQRRPAGVNFYCDASVLSRAGIPSVVFGPGDIAQAHTADEWISLRELERGKDMLVKFLKSFD